MIRYHTVENYQINMVAAEDPEFLEDMRRARIKGEIVGIESVTPEGLKSIQVIAWERQSCTFHRRGVHVLGTFIFGMPTDQGLSPCPALVS